MDDRIDVVLDKDLSHQELGIGDIAQVESRFGRHRPAKAGRKAIEHDNVFAGVKQRPDHVATDIAGAARHQNRHVLHSLLLFEQGHHAASFDSYQTPVRRALNGKLRAVVEPDCRLFYNFIELPFRHKKPG